MKGETSSNCEKKMFAYLPKILYVGFCLGTEEAETNYHARLARTDEINVHFHRDTLDGI
jgi:hypothetical protein